MIGFLIDGQWFAPGAVELVQYLKMQGAKWVPCSGLKEWNDTAEDQRAIRIRTAGGGDIVIERPKSVERKDLFALMVETKPAVPASPGQAEAPAAAPNLRAELAEKGQLLP